MPAVGTMLKLTDDADYIEVEYVYLSLCKNEGLIVMLKEPEVYELRSWPEMEEQGWRTSPSSDADR